MTILLLATLAVIAAFLWITLRRPPCDSPLCSFRAPCRSCLLRFIARQQADLAKPRLSKFKRAAVGEKKPAPVLVAEKKRIGGR
jgi:hypothetical protein